MPLVTVQELIDAGVHFGHQASRWNPKMKPYIRGKRHRIHVIDLESTIRGLYQACHFLRNVAATGAQIMFLGTKRQIRAVLLSEAQRSGMPAVTERWIGGTLTNFTIVRERLTRLEELEAMETSGAMEKFKKRDQASLRREMRKIRRNLEGVRELHGLPGAILVVDPRREDNCMREALRMNVPIVAILDTDCDPTTADIAVPANDDAMSSVQLLLGKMVDAILEGRASADEGTIADAQRTAKDDVRIREVQGRRSMQGGGGPRRGGGGGGRGGGGGGGGGGRFERRGGPQADHVSIVGAAAQAAESVVDPAETPAATSPAPASAAPASPAPADSPAESSAASPPESTAPDASSGTPS